MLRYFFLIFSLVILIVVAMTGFRGHKFTRPPIELFPDMDHQPKVKAQVASTFFADGRGARVPVKDTIPLGYSMPMHKVMNGNAGMMPGPYKEVYFSSLPDYFDTGKMGDQWGTGIPINVTPEVMQRGRDRFTISCAVCHGATGEGNGIAGKYGLVAIANLHQPRIVQMADGEIFNTISHGKNTMMGYGDRIQTPDRWAIICYIRALQKSQSGSTLKDVPAAERATLEAQ